MWWWPWCELDLVAPLVNRRPAVRDLHFFYFAFHSILDRAFSHMLLELLHKKNTKTMAAISLYSSAMMNSNILIVFYTVKHATPSMIHILRTKTYVLNSLRILRCSTDSFLNLSFLIEQNRFLSSLPTMQWQYFSSPTFYSSIRIFHRDSHWWSSMNKLNPTTPPAWLSNCTLSRRKFLEPRFMCTHINVYSHSVDVSANRNKGDFPCCCPGKL